MKTCNRYIKSCLKQKLSQMLIIKAIKCLKKICNNLKGLMSPTCLRKIVLYLFL